MSETHVELAGSRRPAKRGAHRVRDVDPHAHLELTVTLKGPPLPAPEAGARATLDPSEFAKRFGADPADVRKVETVLRDFGLTVDEVASHGLSLRVSGTAAAVQAAFQSNLGIYHSAEHGEYRGREGVIKVPSEIAGIVTGVFGLDQRRVAHRHAASNGAGDGTLTPRQLEQLYNFPDGDANGETIAVAEFGSPMNSGQVLVPAYLPDDVASFCQQQQRPVPDVTIVPVNISPISHDQLVMQLQQLPRDVANGLFMETAETMMDVEIVAALAPGAKIAVYFASWDEKGWVDLLDKVIGGDPAVPVALSISYGLGEEAPDWSNGALQTINARLQAVSMLGITTCVSSGDDGTATQLGGRRAHVEFPASSPFVLSVGGTMMSGPNVQDEVVWWENPGVRTDNGGGATGGGVSAMLPRPPWQQDVEVRSLNSHAIDGRIVPDVAALAGAPSYATVLLGRPFPGGGTSASAPLWAALIARINARLSAGARQRFLTPLLYEKASNGKARGTTCRDITSGNNASFPQPGRGYQAQPNFDAVTGWGVPDGKALLASL